MLKKHAAVLTCAAVSAFAVFLSSCNGAETAIPSANGEPGEKSTQSIYETAAAESLTADENSAENTAANYDESVLTRGDETYRGFVLDNIYHSEKNGDIHFNLCVPDGYDGSEAYALFVTLPGYAGLYFQGVGVNLKEDFAFEAQKYNAKMIVAAPQLNGWDERSADETVDLTEFLLRAYNIDRSKVYIEGYSGGGETASVAVGKRPELFTAFLQVSSQWDGEFESVANAHLPVYFAIGRDDEYYGSEKTQRAYETLYELYKKQGLTDAEIDKILVLDIKEKDYFISRNVNNEHAGGGLFAKDEKIMSWLFGGK